METAATELNVRKQDEEYSFSVDWSVHAAVLVVVVGSRAATEPGDDDTYRTAGVSVAGSGDVEK